MDYELREEMLNILESGYGVDDDNEESEHLDHEKGLE